jgi:hypothetical protein
MPVKRAIRSSEAKGRRTSNKPMGEKVIPKARINIYVPRRHTSIY